MKPLLCVVSVPFLLAGCTGNGVVPQIYQLKAMPGLGSPFTGKCTTLRVATPRQTVDVDASRTNNVIFQDIVRADTSVTAWCMVEDGGRLIETGRTEVTMPRNVNNVYVGSGEGSSIAAEFARTATTSGVYPILQYR